MKLDMNRVERMKKVAVMMFTEVIDQMNFEQLEAIQLNDAEKWMEAVTERIPEPKEDDPITLYKSMFEDRIEPVIDAMVKGRFIEAIKIHRDIYYGGLKETKAICDGMKVEMVERGIYGISR